MGSECQEEGPKYGDQVPKERGQDQGTVCCASLRSAWKATDCHPRKGNSPTFVPVPKTQTRAILHEPAFSKAFLDSLTAPELT